MIPHKTHYINDYICICLDFVFISEISRLVSKHILQFHTFFFLDSTSQESFVEVEQGFATSETGGSGDWREDPIVPGDGSDWD